MWKLLGWLSGSMLAVAVGRGIDPNVTVGGVNAFIIVASSGGIGLILGKIVDQLSVIANRRPV